MSSEDTRKEHVSFDYVGTSTGPYVRTAPVLFRWNLDVAVLTFSLAIATVPSSLRTRTRICSFFSLQVPMSDCNSLTPHASLKPPAGPSTRRSEAGSETGAAGDLWASSVATERGNQRSSSTGAPDDRSPSRLSGTSLRGGNPAQEPGAVALCDALGGEVRKLDAANRSLLLQVQELETKVNTILGVNAELRGRLNAARSGENTEIVDSDTRTEKVHRQEETQLGASERARSEVEELQKTLQEMQALRRELELAQDEVKKIRSEADELRAERDVLRGKNESLRASATQQVSELQQLIAERNDLRKELGEARTEHSQLLRKCEWVCEEHKALFAELNKTKMERSESHSQPKSQVQNKERPGSHSTSRGQNGERLVSHSNSKDQTVESFESIFSHVKSSSTTRNPNSAILDLDQVSLGSVSLPAQRRAIFKSPFQSLGSAAVAGGTASGSAGKGSPSGDHHQQQRPRSSAALARAAELSPGDDLRSVAQGYLDEPVTKALEAVMQKGARALLSSRNKKRKASFPDGDIVCYVCQACSLCRADPNTALCTTYRADEHPDHPLHCPGFASYEVPLPHHSKGALRRHLKQMKETPGVIVADPPAATLC